MNKILISAQTTHVPTVGPAQKDLETGLCVSVLLDLMEQLVGLTWTIAHPLPAEMEGHVARAWEEAPAVCANQSSLVLCAP